MRSPSTRRRLLHAAAPKRKVSLTTLLVAITGLILVTYVFALAKLHRGSQQDSPLSQQHSPSQHDSPLRKQDGIMRYQEWRQLAVDLSKLPASQVLKELEAKDPFGVRSFEKLLLEKETQNGAILTMEDLLSLFHCPTNRITLPDQRDHAKAQAFRANEPGYFLFFQHLRKAGGTHFCSLARENLPKTAVADYYCMSDYAWSREVNKQMAGYLHHWSNEEISSRMKKSGHRISGNEWDNFDRLHHFELPAAFATSFRRPMDRALSQYRFECLEDRGCTIKDVGAWWKQVKYLWNVYTVTFSDVGRGGIVQVFEGNSRQHQEKRAQLMGDALDTVAKFNLVLSMEWLAYAKPQVTSVLGFENTSALTHRVRPHIASHKRNDGQEENKLGAAGISKASLTPEEYLTPEQYRDFAEHLALDEILTDAARRIFLERLVCNDLES